MIFALLDGEVIGFALYFLSFPTYVGNINMPLEDIFIEPEYLKRRYGKAFLKEFGDIVLKRSYGHFECTCLSWNKASIEFYLSIGAEMKDWELFHFKGESLENL